MQLPAGRPALKEIVSEAARALAQLDADRLEELALSCRAFNRELTRDPAREETGDSPPVPNRDRNSGSLPIKESERARLAAEARAARHDMATFARILEATRANVQVIESLRALRSGRLEYTAGPTVDFDRRWGSTGDLQEENKPGEPGHGND